MDQVESVKRIIRIVRRMDQLAVILRHIENEKQFVELAGLAMDLNARARRLMLLGNLIDRYSRHLDRLEQLLGRAYAPAQEATAGLPVLVESAKPAA